MSLWGFEYHEKTGYDRDRMDMHGLDWSSQPSVFKSPDGLSTLDLEPPESLPESTLSEILDAKSTIKVPEESPIGTLSEILFLAHEVTAKTGSGPGAFYFRSPASAGALYPFELYVCCRGISGIPDGVHHHNAATQTLAHLGPFNESSLSVDASCGLAFVLTSIFFRSAWKYRDRAYRYCLLDTGHLLENLLLALKSQNIDHAVHYDFDDDAVNGMLNLDTGREVALAVVTTDTGATAGENAQKDPDHSDEVVENPAVVSSGEKSYDLIREIHTSSSVVRKDAHAASQGQESSSPISLSPADSGAGRLNYAEAVLRRRSCRHFAQMDIGSSSFNLLLRLICSEMENTGGCTSTGFVCSRVEGVAPGFYMLDPGAKEFVPVVKKNIIHDMARACLEQHWLADCGAHFVFISDLKELDSRRGPRGYRHAMLDAGRLGQLIYVAATVLGLGCCGIGAFFDREAAACLQLEEDASMLYLLGVGNRENG